MSDIDKRQYHSADWIGTGPGPAAAHDLDLGLWLTSSGNRAALSASSTDQAAEVSSAPGDVADTGR